MTFTFKFTYTTTDNKFCLLLFNYVTFDGIGLMEFCEYCIFGKDCPSHFYRKGKDSKGSWRMIIYNYFFSLVQFFELKKDTKDAKNAEDKDKKDLKQDENKGDEKKNEENEENKDGNMMDYSYSCSYNYELKSNFKQMTFYSLDFRNMKFPKDFFDKSWKFVSDTLTMDPLKLSENKLLKTRVMFTAKNTFHLMDNLNPKLWQKIKCDVKNQLSNLGKLLDKQYEEKKWGEQIENGKLKFKLAGFDRQDHDSLLGSTKKLIICF